MRWIGQRQSGNIEDRRGMSVGRSGAAIGGGGLLLLVLFAVITGQDPVQLLEMVGGGSSVSVEQGEGRMGAPPDELGQFASVVLASTEDVWSAELGDLGRQYVPPRLVLFSGAVESACGFGSAAVGPFYCPADSRVYIDLSFFDELARRFGAAGDFAQAYVIAHEVGHHVQNLLGISSKAQDARAQAGEEQANAVSVRVELQADCFAGVWAAIANREKNLLEPGDLEEGLRAAAAIGDDQLQRKSQGYTVPETWTHGSSEQRVRWLRRGFDRADMQACDTFGAGAL